MVKLIRRVGHLPNIPETRFPWWLMRALGLFGGFPREVGEIAPFWRHPVRLDNSRLRLLLGEEPTTPIEDAVGMALKQPAAIA
jgi:nucleoside-diphosphate-sugar epimerase